MDSCCLILTLAGPLCTGARCPCCLIKAILSSQASGAARAVALGETVSDPSCSPEMVPLGWYHGCYIFSESPHVVANVEKKTFSSNSTHDLTLAFLNGGNKK